MSLLWTGMRQVRGRRAGLGRESKKRHNLRQVANWAPLLIAIITFVFLGWFLGTTWMRFNLGTILTVSFGLMGLYYSVVTSVALNNIEQTEHLLYEDIINLEDATRRNLIGFSEIFARALWLLGKAQDEIWYVNFLFGFGSPHLNCPIVASKYAEIANVLALPDRSFPEAVRAFTRTLIQKIQTTPRFHAITLKQESLSGLFLERLNVKSGYQGINVGSLVSEENERYSAIAQARFLRKQHGLDISGFEFRQIERLPFQVLIASIPGRESNETRLGCLVFLVGTENIGGEPRGFYTELDHVAGVYKSVAEGLEESCEVYSWSSLLQAVKSS